MKILIFDDNTNDIKELEHCIACLLNEINEKYTIK